MQFDNDIVFEALAAIQHKDYTPKELPPFFDCSQFDDDIEMCDDYIRSPVTYLKGSDHPLFGRKRPEVGVRISAAKVGRSYPKCSRKGNPNWNGVQEKAAAAARKRVLVNGCIYNSCTEASKAVGVTLGTFTYWIKTGKATIVETKDDGSNDLSS